MFASLRTERELLEGVPVDDRGTRYIVKYLKMIWLGVAQPRSDGCWEYDVLEKCKMMVNEMSTIGFVSGVTASGLNVTLQTLRTTVAEMV